MADNVDKKREKEAQERELRIRRATAFAAMSTIQEEKEERARQEAEKEREVQERIENGVRAAVAGGVLFVADPVARKLLEAIENRLAGKPDMQELKLLAAQKMYILQQVGSGKNGDKLHDALEEEKMDRKVQRILLDENFQNMCAKLGHGELMSLMQGDGARLLAKYADAVAHPEAYAPEAEKAPEVQRSQDMERQTEAEAEAEGPVLKLRPEDWPPQ